MEYPLQDERDFEYEGFGPRPEMEDEQPLPKPEPQVITWPEDMDVEF